MATDTPVTIRRAVQDDASTLGRLGALLVRTHHDFDPHRFIQATPHTEHGYGSFLKSQLDADNVVILVAERANAVIGYAYAAIEGYDYMALRGPAAVLNDIVVEPAHRGRGVGLALLDGMITELESRGAPIAVLSTADRNEAAQRFFSRAGFRRTMVEMTRALKR